MVKVDYRAIVFLVIGAIFLVFGGITALFQDENQVFGTRGEDDLAGTAAGLLTVAGVCCILFVVMVTGFTTRDERDLFGDEAAGTANRV